MWEYGILDKWKRDMQPARIELCAAGNKKNGPVAQQSSIKLIDLSSAFFVLGVGVSVSLIAFLFEIIVASTSRRIEVV